MVHWLQIANRYSNFEEEEHAYTKIAHRLIGWWDVR